MHAWAVDERTTIPAVMRHSSLRQTACGVAAQHCSLSLATSPDAWGRAAKVVRVNTGPKNR